MVRASGRRDRKLNSANNFANVRGPSSARGKRGAASVYLLLKPVYYDGRRRMTHSCHSTEKIPANHVRWDQKNGFKRRKCYPPEPQNCFSFSEVGRNPFGNSSAGVRGAAFPGFFLAVRGSQVRIGVRSTLENKGPFWIIHILPHRFGNSGERASRANPRTIPSVCRSRNSF